MKLLKQKLSAYQHTDELEEVLAELKLDVLLNRALETIESKLGSNSLSDLPALATLVLNDINSVLSTVENVAKKKKIEYFLGDIFEDYLQQISRQENPQQTLQEIANAMKTVCDFKGYDFDKLSERIRIEKYQVLLPSQENKGRGIYYKWLKNPDVLDELAKDLVAKKYIYSAKEFKRMFNPIKGNLNVQYYRERLDETIILFTCLKELKFIKPRGISGHFAPFAEYAVDDEKVFLIKKRLFKENERIKKNMKEYNAIREKTKKWLLSLA